MDMLHLNGTSGKVAYTRSVASILAGAGLTSLQEAEQVARNKAIQIRRAGGQEFRTQGRRGRGSPPQQQLSTFQLATNNRFASFQGNC